jgi:hypothetical protein
MFWMKGVGGHGPCTSTNNLSTTTHGSAESCLRSALAGTGDKTDDYVAFHPLTAWLSRKQERYAGVDAYASCHHDVRLYHHEVTPAMTAGRMRKREAR